jgi:hypothetical protein
MESADKTCDDRKLSGTDTQSPFLRQQPENMIERQSFDQPTPSIEEKGAIKMAEFRCNCLESIMPLTESGAINPQDIGGSIDPKKLPDGIATKTLPDGTTVLVNYERLLQIEATKRIFFQRSVEKYVEITAKLQMRLREADAREKANLVSQARDNIQTNHHRQLNFGLPHPNQWLQQHSKTKTICLSLKCLLIASMLWLAFVNVSVHSLVLKKIMVQQLIEERRRKKSFSSLEETTVLLDSIRLNATNLTSVESTITTNRTVNNS